MRARDAVCNIFYFDSPKRPPYIETHRVEPEKRRQKDEMHYNS